MGRRKTEEIRRAFEQELPKVRRDGVTLNPGQWGPFKRLVRAHGLGGFDFDVLDGRALRLCIHGKNGVELVHIPIDERPGDPVLSPLGH